MARSAIAGIEFGTAGHAVARSSLWSRYCMWKAKVPTSGPSMYPTLAGRAMALSARNAPWNQNRQHRYRDSNQAGGLHGTGLSPGVTYHGEGGGERATRGRGRWELRCLTSLPRRPRAAVQTRQMLAGLSERAAATRPAPRLHFAKRMKPVRPLVHSILANSWRSVATGAARSPRFSVP